MKPETSAIQHPTVSSGLSGDANVVVSEETPLIQRDGGIEDGNSARTSALRNRWSIIDKVPSTSNLALSPMVSASVTKSGQLMTPVSILNTGLVNPDDPLAEVTKCTESEAFANFLNYMFGAAFVFYPFVMAQAGVWGFLICLFVLSVLSVHTGLCLNTVLEDEPVETFGEITLKLLGQNWLFVVVSIQYAELFFYLCGYIVLMGDNLVMLCGASENHWLSIPMGRLLGTVIVAPSLLLKTASSIAPLSVWSVRISFVMVGLLVLGEFINKPHSPYNPVTEIKWFDWSTLFLSHSSLMIGFSGHAVLPELKGQMENPDRFRNVFKNTYIVLITAYISTTFTAYLTFGADTGNQISLNFSGWIGYLIQIFIFINGYSRFALTTFPISLFVEQQMHKYKRRKWYWKFIYSFRLGVALLAWIVSCLLGNLDQVMGVVGIVCATFFVYIISLMLYNVHVGREHSCAIWCLNWVIIIFGTLSAVLGFYQLLMGSADGQASSSA